ncbi:MAG: hypothetical protein AAGA56_04885 [Myxococcota bacterium]
MRSWLLGCALSFPLVGFACGDDDPNGPGGMTPDPGDPSGPGGGTAGGGAGAATDDPTPLAQSGGRLKRRNNMIGAVAQFVDWFDTTLGVACSLVETSLDTLHCVPDSSMSLVYLDAACTQPAALQDDCADGDFVVSRTRAPFCEDDAFDEVSVFRKGSPRESATPIFVRNGSDTCRASAVGDGSTLYDVTEVGRGDLARATLSVEPRGAGLSARVFQGADESAGIFGLLDAERDGERCRATVLPGQSEPVCLPRSAAAHQGYFVTDTCMSTLVVAPFCGAPPAFGYQVVEEQGCDIATLFFETGGSAEGRGLMLNGFCFDGVDPLSGFALEPMLAEPPAVPLTLAEETVAGVRVRRATDSEGNVVAELGLRLAETDEPCTLRRTVGGFRCLPGGEESGDLIGLFSDAACTQPIAQAAVNSCADGYAYETSRELVGSCPGPSQVDTLYRFDAPAEGPRYDRSEGGACSPVGNAPFRTLGPPLSPLLFPVVENLQVEQ